MGIAEGNCRAGRRVPADCDQGGGKSQYTFTVPEDVISKDVHWYLMMSDSYYSKPQREEYFMDSGYYKFHEAYHLLKFPNEKQILEKAYNEYMELKKNNLWKNHR